MMIAYFMGQLRQLLGSESFPAIIAANPRFFAQVSLDVASGWAGDVGWQPPPEKRRTFFNQGSSSF
jgi:hypothetical protein